MIPLLVREILLWGWVVLTVNKPSLTKSPLLLIVPYTVNRAQALCDMLANVPSLFIPALPTIADTPMVMVAELVKVEPFALLRPLPPVRSMLIIPTPELTNVAEAPVLTTPWALSEAEAPMVICPVLVKVLVLTTPLLQRSTRISPVLVKGA